MTALIKSGMQCFHAFLFLLYPFIAALEFNYFEVYLADLFSILPWVLFCAISLLFILRKLTGSLELSSIILTFSNLAALSYGLIVKFVRGEGGEASSGLVNLTFQSVELLVMIPLLSVLFLIARFLLKHRSWLRDITISLNVFAILLLCFSLLGISLSYVEQSRVDKGPDPLSDIKWEAGPESPDLYYIILDGFGGPEMLLRKYDFKNDILGNVFKQYNFFQAEKSLSNYHRTNYSLASSLNSSYLEKPLFFQQKRVSAKRIAEALIQDSGVLKVFQRANYEIVSPESGYRTTELKNLSGYVPLLEQNYILSTALGYFQLPFLRYKFSEYLHDMRRKRITDAYIEVQNLATSFAPKFVFFHVIAPHPPFVFNADGSHYFPEIAYMLGDGHGFEGAPDYRERYRQQAKYISKLTADLIHSLMRLPRRPIIIIQGDHGPGSDYHLESLESTDLCERHSILNAFYFPDQDYSRLYPGISPVNTFRVVLNKLAGSSLDLLPDRAYFSTMSRPYDFRRVDELARSSQYCSGGL